MTLLKSLLLAAALVIPGAASAAPVSVFSSGGAVLFDGQFAEFYDDGADGTDIAFVLEYVGGTLTGSLMVSDATGTLVESSSIFDVLFDLQPGPDSVTLLFNTLSGSAAAVFGDLMTAVISFSAEDEDAGGFDPVNVTILAEALPAPIPVPASLGLLLLSLGAVGGVARRRV